MASSFPNSTHEVLALITVAEQKKKLAWTSSRVLKTAALWTELDKMSPSDRKSVLSRTTQLLENLAVEGVLERRPVLHSIGFGNEVAFDYIG